MKRVCILEYGSVVSLEPRVRVDISVYEKVVGLYRQEPHIFDPERPRKKWVKLFT